MRPGMNGPKCMGRFPYTSMFPKGILHLYPPTLFPTGSIICTTCPKHQVIYFANSSRYMKGLIVIVDMNS